MNIEQTYNVYDRETLVRIGRIPVRVPERLSLLTRKPPAELALDAFYSWIGQYADFVQQRFERVA